MQETPQQNMGPSHAQFLLVPRTNTLVPTLSLKKRKAQYDANDYKNDAKANASENGNSRNLTKLYAGDNVRMQPIQSGKNEWPKASVDKVLLSQSLKLSCYIFYLFDSVFYLVHIPPIHWVATTDKNHSIIY